MNFLREAVNSRRKYLGENELNHLDFVKEACKIAKEMFIQDEMLKRYVNVGFSGGEKNDLKFFKCQCLNPNLQF